MSLLSNIALITKDVTNGLPSLLSFTQLLSTVGASSAPPVEKGFAIANGIVTAAEAYPNPDVDAVAALTNMVLELIESAIPAPATTTATTTSTVPTVTVASTPATPAPVAAPATVAVGSTPAPQASTVAPAAHTVSAPIQSASATVATAPSTLIPAAKPHLTFGQETERILSLGLAHPKPAMSVPPAK